MLKLNSVEEAVLIKKELIAEINYILNRDLEILDQTERTISRWFGLLGKYEDFAKTAAQLDEMTSKLVDIDKYINNVFI